jgi:hypothetical protein
MKVCGAGGPEFTYIAENDVDLSHAWCCFEYFRIQCTVHLSIRKHTEENKWCEKFDSDQRTFLGKAITFSWLETSFFL